MRNHGLEVELAIGSAIDQLAESGELDLPESHAASLTKLQLTGFGELQPFLDDPDIEELWLNSSAELRFYKNGQVHTHPLEITSEQLATLISRMLRTSGRRLDRMQPFVDSALPDGSRLHAVIPQVTRDWAVNIRKFRSDLKSLNALVAAQLLSTGEAAELRAAMRAGASMLVTGATQAGKTTMLSALLAELDSTERIISVEDTFELNLQNPDWVAMQTVSRSGDAEGEVTLRELVRQSLRMRPSRLVIGEVRGAESLDLLIAVNSGIPALCTLHANSARAAITKLMTLPLLAGENITREFLETVVPGAFQYVIHLGRDAAGQRRVLEILRVT